MGPVMALRKQTPKFERPTASASVHGLFVKAACAALQSSPSSTPRLTATTSFYHGFIDIGIAVGSPAAWSFPSCATPTR